MDGALVWKQIQNKIERIDKKSSPSLEGLYGLERAWTDFAPFFLPKSLFFWTSWENEELENEWVSEWLNN